MPWRHTHWGSNGGLGAHPCFGVKLGLSPFIGQNWGAHLEERGRKVLSSPLSSQRHGAFVLAALFLGGPTIAALFSEDPTVQKDITIYLQVVRLVMATGR